MQTQDAIGVRGIDITTYLVKDVERAKAFYRDTMGFKVTQEYADQGCEFTFEDDTTFGLWRMEDGTWNPGAGVMFAVDDLHKAMDTLKSRGVKFEEHVVDSPACYMAFAEDSEGNWFILHQRKGGR